MHRSEHEGPSVLLIAGGGNPSVVIEVSDARFKTVASGVGRLEVPLAPGFYAVRFSAGDAVEERHVALMPGQTSVTVPDPVLRFHSAAPLRQTATTRKHHRNPARRISRKVTSALGSGSRVFIFVRELDHRGRGHPAAGLELLDTEGTTLSRLETMTESGRGPDEEPWAGLTLELDPGPYVLQHKAPRGPTVRMAVHACEGWQTQVFLIRRRSPGPRGVRRPDFNEASVLMARAFDGFDPDGRHTERPADAEFGWDVRLAELALKGLAESRAVVRPQDLQSLLSGKFSDPMLGILGGHLLLLDPEPDLELLAAVIDNLQGLFHGYRHPDVDCLRIWLAAARQQTLQPEPLAAPPMLRSSWDLLVDASSMHPQLIPADSLPGRLATRLWGSGPWLVWTEPRRAESRAEAECNLGVSLAQLVLNDLEGKTGQAELDGLIANNAAGWIRIVDEKGLRSAQGQAHSYLEHIARGGGPVELIPKIERAVHKIEDVAVSAAAKSGQPGDAQRGAIERHDNDIMRTMVRERIMPWLRKTGSREAFEERGERLGLNEAEFAILDKLYEKSLRSHTIRNLETSRDEHEVSTVPDTAELVQSLKLPSSLISRSMLGIGMKLAKE